jgi:hypothetical protein
MLRSSVVGHGSGPRLLVLDGSKGTHKSIIMTPKEKAIELHNKILDITYDDRDIPGEPTWVSTKCALIAVDEILDMVKHTPIEFIETDYWQEVKQEIEKL